MGIQQPVLGLLMSSLKEESGSSLIWFISLLVLVVSICLVLVSSIHQFLFARELKDFVEQYALAGKAYLDRGSSLVSAKSQLENLVLNMESIRDLAINNFSLLDANTLQVVACAKWSDPLPVIQVSREVCESALAR